MLVGGMRAMVEDHEKGTMNKNTARRKDMKILDFPLFPIRYRNSYLAGQDMERSLSSSIHWFPKAIQDSRLCQFPS
jgi:hypothetical protein